MKTLAQPDSTTDLLLRLQAVRPDSACRWGRMTAHQMICHLSDAFRMSLGEKAVVPTSNALTRSALKFVVLYVPLRWPPGITSNIELDQAQGGTRPTEFSADVALLVTLTRRAAAPATTFVNAHPLFGRMSQADWRRWGWLHVDHHLRQFGV